MKRCLTSAAACAVLTLLTAVRAAEPTPPRVGDWPSWRGPHGDGISRETGILKQWPEQGLKVLWKAPLGGGYSSVAVAGGKVYTHTSRDKKEEIVLCFDAASGKELWRHGYDCDYDKTLMTEQFDHGPRSTPAVDGGRVYTLGASGVLLCLDAASGKKLWELDLPKMVSKRVTAFGYCASPLVVGERLYVQAGGTKGNSILALNKHSGQVIWQSLDDRLSYSTPIWIEFNGSPQLVCFTSEGAVGVSPADGKALWRHEWKAQSMEEAGGGFGGKPRPPGTPGKPGAPRGGFGKGMMEINVNAATPIHANGQVFISSGYGRGGALLQLQKESDPKVVWQNRTMQNQYVTSIVYQGSLYGFSNTRLRCLDLATGLMAWDKNGLKGSLTLADGHLIILTERGEVVLAEANPKEYVEKARCKPISGSCLSVPVLADGRLFIRSETQLMALDIKNP